LVTTADMLPLDAIYDISYESNTVTLAGEYTLFECPNPSWPKLFHPQAYTLDFDSSRYTID